MTQSSRTTRQHADDHEVTRTAGAPAQAVIADQRASTAAQRQQLAAMHGSAGAVAQQQRAEGMARHTQQGHAQGGAAALQMKADGEGVAQLGVIDWIKDKIGMGKDASRRVNAKKEKLKLDAGNVAKGVYKGGLTTPSRRYQALGAKTEDDFYNDMLDEESADRERMTQHPVLESGRIVLNGTAGLAISAGKDALNGLAPMSGTAVGKLASMGKDKANDYAKKKIGEDTNPYKVLRDNADYDD